MKYYLKLYLEYTKINLKSLSIYRNDFLFGVFSMALKNILNFIQIYFIFSLTNSISGWSIEQMVLLYSGSVISFAVWRCFFIHTMTIPYFVRSGDMDIFLLKPTNTLFQIIVYGFDEDAWGDLFVGVVLYIIAVIVNGIPFLSALVLFILFVLSSLIFISISLFFSSLTLRSNGELTFSQLNYTFADISKYPINIFDKRFQFVFTYIIPIGYISYYPITILLYSLDITHILMFLSALVIIFSLSYMFWARSFSKYVSSGT